MIWPASPALGGKGGREAALLAPMLQHPYVWSLPTPRTLAGGPREIPEACTQPERPAPGPRHSCNHPLGHGDPQRTVEFRGSEKGTQLPG